jgi:hypothetical protein
MRGCLDDRITYKGFNYKELDEAMFNVQVETEAYKAALKVLSLSDSIYIIMAKLEKLQALGLLILFLFASQKARSQTTWKCLDLQIITPLNIRFRLRNI